MIDNHSLEAMARQADLMMRENNRVFSKKNIKRTVLSRSLHKDPFFWNNGVLSWSIYTYERMANRNERYPANSNILSKKPVATMVDDFLFFYANYDRYDNDSINELIAAAKELKQDSEGSIFYRAGNQNVFIDTLGMICPFLIRYGAENNDKDALNLAMNQFDLFFQHGFDEKTGLPYHGYDTSDMHKCGIFGWGRGIGWLLVGIVESMNWLKPNSTEYIKLSQYYDLVILKTMPYQLIDGGFSWQVQATEGHFDLSTTSMIGYAIARHNATTKKPMMIKELSKLIVKVLNNINSDGIALSSSAECKGFSMYPQVFESNSWGQGFALLLLTETSYNKQAHHIKTFRGDTSNE